jgi:hypothetical protein
MEEPIRQLVYVSNAEFGILPQDIEGILSLSRKNNADLKVTGILVYADGVFIQVLEGDHKTIGDLYDKISDDRRHNKVALISDQFCNERTFPGWSMAYLSESAVRVGEWAGVPGVINSEELLEILIENGDSISKYLLNFAEALEQD